MRDSLANGREIGAANGEIAREILEAIILFLHFVRHAPLATHRAVQNGAEFRLFQLLSVRHTLELE